VPRRLLTIGHSYGIALNRRLADAMARVGADRWEVTAVAPEWLAGELRPVPFEPNPNEKNTTLVVPVYFSQRVHHLLYGRTTRQIVRQRNWDLIHCWQEPFVLSAAQIGWWSEPTPIIYYTYQNIPKRYPPPFNWSENWAMSRATGWIAGGHTVLQAVQTRKYYSTKPVQLITLGVDCQTFFANRDDRNLIHQRLNWSSGPPIIGYLGRFTEEKGVGLLVRVLNTLKTPWRALFVGGGPLEASLRQWATKFGDRVRVVTGVKHAEVPAYLNAMDLLVAPSQTTPKWREQFGRMLIEGFACGLTVIGSDSGEIPYVIGDAGRVVSETDDAAWTKCISELLESPDIRRELGERGRARVLQEFDWPIIARKHLNFFEEVLENRPSSSS
jgi:glycosyltransferase involved in cell wall biosynthesis